MEEEIESELSYGDSKSEWIRHAIRMRQHVNPILDEVNGSYQREERLGLIEVAVREKVDELKQGDEVHKKD